MAISTAIALSARFPYVTPPANIRRNESIENPRGLFEKIKVLELLDGAYFDNSGGWVAIDILEDLERYLRAERRAGPISRNSRTTSSSSSCASPIARPSATATRQRGRAFRAGDAADRLQLGALGARSTIAGLSELKEDERDLPLSLRSLVPAVVNWLLTEDTKAKIELRSGGQAGAEKEVCCRVIAPPPKGRRRKRRAARSPREMLLLAGWEDAKKLADNPELKDWQVEKFVPNNGPAFAKLLALVKDGDERTAPPVGKSIAAAAVDQVCQGLAVPAGAHLARAHSVRSPPGCSRPHCAA